MMIFCNTSHYIYHYTLHSTLLIIHYIDNNALILHFSYRASHFTYYTTPYIFLKHTHYTSHYTLQGRSTEDDRAEWTCNDDIWRVEECESLPISLPFNQLQETCRQDNEYEEQRTVSSLSSPPLSAEDPRDDGV